MSSPAAAAARPRRATHHEPRVYDFRRPSKLNRSHVRTLHIAYETFARQFTTILTSTVRTFSLVDLTGVEQLSYVDYVESLPNPSFIVLASIDPLPGTAVLQLPHRTAMLCVDRLLGGPGADEQPERLLTAIETQLLRSVGQRVIHELRYAFDGISSLSPDVVGMESDPQFMQAAAPSDIFVVASFRVSVGEQDDVATLAVPFGGLYPVLEIAAEPKRGDRHGEAARSAVALQTLLRDVPVDVSVEFTPVALTSEQIVSLAVGDVLALRHATNRPLHITSGGVVFGYAVPGSTGKRVACRVVEPPQLSERAEQERVLQ